MPHPPEVSLHGRARTGPGAVDVDEQDLAGLDGVEAHLHGSGVARELSFFGSVKEREY